MSTTANPLSFFKQPVQRYYDELPHSITQAVVGGAAISFAITALGYNNPSVGLIASAASMALTLVDAALRPFFNRYLPYSPDGLLNLANHAIRVIIVGAIVSAAAAAAAPIIGTGHPQGKKRSADRAIADN